MGAPGSVRLLTSRASVPPRLATSVETRRRLRETHTGSYVLAVEAWDLIRLVHLLALAFFVGGQLVLAVAIVPSLRDPAERAALRAIARRFGVGAVVALAVLVATGAAMATHYGRWDEGALHLKLGGFALVGVLVGIHLRRPDSRPVAVALLFASIAVVWLGVGLAH
jgi:hypothetical protein